MQTIAYTVMYGDKETKVCKKGFVAIFGISEKRARVALCKMTLGKTTTLDQRGKQSTVTKFIGDKADLVRVHIRMLPTMTSHYSRAKSQNRVYMDSNLSIVKLYDMFVSFMKQDHPDVEIVSFNYYSKVFRTEFNIGFAPPKIDSCNACDLFVASLSNAKQLGMFQEALDEIRRNMEWHKELGRQGRSLIDDFHDDSDDIMVLCFDLEQTLPTPKLSASVAYYKRKLWTYNFCIYNLQTRKSTM